MRQYEASSLDADKPGEEKRVIKRAQIFSRRSKLHADKQVAGCDLDARATWRVRAQEANNKTRSKMASFKRWERQQQPHTVDKESCTIDSLRLQ